MVKVCFESDGDLTLLKDIVLNVIGLGNSGEAHAYPIIETEEKPLNRMRVLDRGIVNQ